jgi:hypothetical protein
MSNLLSQASLVMIPSGYKEDVVYSQIPTNGNGDLSFTRASNGTRVNSAGLVEVVAWNLAQQSETFDNASWTKVNTTITANNTTAPNGTTTADKFAPNGTLTASYFSISQAITSGATSQSHTAIVYVKAGGLGQMLFYLGSQIGIYFNLTNGQFISYYNGVQTITNYSSEAVGDGWYKYTISISGSSGIIYHEVYGAKSGAFIGNYTTADDCFVWGAQLNIGSTAKPYFPTTDRLNVPRLTYQNGGGGCPSLLLEKQSTNIAIYSEQFNDASWGKSNITVTANDAISPDGTQNADKITSTNASNTIQLAVSSSSGVDYTISVFAKNIDAGNVRLDMSNVAFGPVFTFATKTFTTVSGWTTSYQEFSNGWFRLIATRQSNTTSASPQFGLDSVVGSVYFWGAQFEQSSYPTSYIPTTSASATRVADACFKTGISSLIGQTEGTMFADFVFTNNNTVQVIMCLHDNADNKRVEIWANASSLYGFVGGSSNFNIASITATSGTRYKVAVAYKSGDSAYYVNGTQIGANSTTFTISLTSLIFNYWASSYPPDTKINEAIIFPTRLTNAELASLTTI